MRARTRWIAATLMAGLAATATAATAQERPDDGTATVVDADSLIGREVPPYPPGLDELGGTCFSAPGTGPGSEVCAYSVSIHGTDMTHVSHALALRQIGRDGNHAVWRVLDAVERPAIEDAAFVPMGCEPLDDGRSVILALAKTDATQAWFEPVHKAWVFDFEAERLIEVDATGVHCPNEGYGYDG